MRRPSTATLASFLSVGGVAAFVLWQLHPSLLLSNTTTAGGDTGAHVALPAYLRSHLLTHGRITGWSPEWYDGYPALTLYFPLPSLVIAVASWVIPYNIAFKLVTVLGMLTLPVAAWGMGRLFKLPRPGPACLGVATLPFLFDRSFTIYGGNIASTLAGEFAFSISLSIALVFLGVVSRGLDTGRHRAVAASLFAICLLCHLIPAIFAAAGALVLVVMRAERRRVWWATTMGLAGLAVTGFWVLPFVADQRYSTDMGYQKVSDYLHSLFPSGQRWVLAMAVVGVGGSLLYKRRTGIFLSAMAVIAAGAFVLDPQGELYNARLLPFWVLCLYLLAGLGAMEVGVAAARVWRRLERAREARPQVLAAGGTGRPASRHGGGSVADLPGAVATPLMATAAALVFVVLPLVSLPSWLNITPSFVPAWVNWNYSGYEGKAAYPEYRSLIQTMSTVGRQHGCGRAMWEYEPELDQLGTPMALMLLPYWTNLCIDSMEGLFFESSATTPYHFLNQAELSLSPSEPERGLPYEPLDVAKGVQHLQLLGVRYYMAVSPAAKAQADADRDLRLVATSGPWPVTVSNQRVTQTWNVYQVADSEEVTPLTNQPVVLAGGDTDKQAWQNAAVAWYQDPAAQDVALAARGPAAWKKVGSNEASSSRTPVAPARVSHITTDTDRISFDVNRTGSPVLVKTSYFPNWHVSGARGPFRVAPNLMVVVPTSGHVSLHYGYTKVDVAGWGVTAAGLLAVVLLALGDRFVARRRAGPGGERRVEGPPVDMVGEEELVGSASHRSQRAGGVLSK